MIRFLNRLLKKDKNITPTEQDDTTKICTNCTCHRVRSYRRGGFYDACMRGVELGTDLVSGKEKIINVSTKTGKILECRWERIDGECGPSGKYYKERIKKAME
jgi:hypothetical protein